MSSIADKNYQYKLVEFPDDEAGPLSVDIVPGHWIFYDDEREELMCKYMAGDLTEKKKKEIRKMVQQCKPANPEWPSHRVEVKGRACSYADAEIAINKLDDKNYAFSTDNEIRCQEKANQEKKLYQRKKLNSKSQQSVEDLLETARIDLTVSPPERPGKNSPTNTQCKSCLRSFIRYCFL